MIPESSSSVMEAAPVQESVPGLNREINAGAGTGRLLQSFRKFMILVSVGSVFLPPLAYLSSPADGDVIPSPGELYLRMGVYGAIALAILVAFYLLLRKVQDQLSNHSLDQAAFLESIPDRYLSGAIAGAAALSLSLELAVIRWQGSIFEFFAFYKNFGLLIFLRWGLPSRPYSLETIPFREQINMGLMATWDQIGTVYLLLAVVFLLTALAFVPVGQLCGKLMERKSQLPAYGFNLLGSLAGVSLMFLISFLWTPPVVWFGLCLAISLFFFVRKPKTLLLAMGLTLVALITLAWPVNPLWNKVYSPYQSLDIGYGPNGLMFIRAAGHYYQRVHNLSDAAVGASISPAL